MEYLFIYLCLQFLLTMSYCFRCVDLSHPWLNISLGTLFLCNCQWDCFLSDSYACIEMLWFSIYWLHLLVLTGLFGYFFSLPFIHFPKFSEHFCNYYFKFFSSGGFLVSVSLGFVSGVLFCSFIWNIPLFPHFAWLCFCILGETAALVLKECSLEDRGCVSGCSL